jgi:hypothetical protein
MNTQDTNSTDYEIDGYSYEKKSTFFQFNGFETVIIILCILAILGVFIFGLFTQNTKNRDLQRETDFELTIIPAVENFYNNSAAVESSKKYPIAKCAQDLNEVDYELVLRQALTGEIPELDTFKYITPDKFPTDPRGVFVTTLKERSDKNVAYRCTAKLNFSTVNENNRIYPNFNSCVFKRDDTGLRHCYLYGSSASGDEYRLAYYKEETNCFIIYKRYKNQNRQKTLC